MSGFPLSRGAAGKALLLNLPDNDVRALLREPDVLEPVGGVPALLAELAASRQRDTRWHPGKGPDVAGTPSLARVGQAGPRCELVVSPSSRMGIV